MVDLGILDTQANLANNHKLDKVLYAPPLKVKCKISIMRTSK